MAEFNSTLTNLDNAGVDLSIRQLRLLIRLGATGSFGLTFKELTAEFHSWNKPSISRGGDRLEKLGWLKRVQTPEDRRGVRFVLTARGLAEAVKIGNGYEKQPRRRKEAPVAEAA